MPVGKAPPFLTLELTNYCNLSCDYCSSPLGLRPKGFMTAEIFERLIEDIERYRIERVRIVGVGEPTMHPRFCEMLERLSRVCGYLQVVSNGHWSPPAADAMIRHCATLAVSVEGNNAAEFRASRKRGKFNAMLANLTEFSALREQARSRVIVAIRIMLRPSQQHRRPELKRFWASYGDSVQFLKVMNELRNGDTDVYEHPQSGGKIPRCASPFTQLQLIWDGTVSLCGNSQFQVGNPLGLVIGNIRDRSLAELWQDETFRQYRRGHRTADGSLTPICAGCHGS